MQQLMQAITAAILAAALGFGLAWYLGYVEGNFALTLFVASLVTGIYWVAEKLYFYPQRKKAAQELEASDQRRRAELAKAGISKVDGDVSEAKANLLMQPWWLDWTAGLFPVIVVVFLLRSFLFEPFKIPSGSMIPTLMIGDLILVNKFTYGLRLPVLHTKLTQGNKPQRGDVMVFRYPPKPSLDYIKRVVGVPGDEVAYLNKQLTINGKAIEKKPLTDFLDEDTLRYSKHFEEQLGPDGGPLKTLRLLNEADRPAFIPGVEPFAFAENCKYSVEGVVCKVPPGHYFMMGDNRDNSLDSRYWGFVPEQNIVGKAFFVWMNFGNLKRIGSFE
jgi:signal peptidase I